MWRPRDAVLVAFAQIVHRSNVLMYLQELAKKMYNQGGVIVLDLASSI